MNIVLCAIINNNRTISLSKCIQRVVQYAYSALSSNMEKSVGSVFSSSSFPLEVTQFWAHHQRLTTAGTGGNSEVSVTMAM